MDALGGDALTRAQTLGDGVLQRSKAQSSSKDGSQHGDLLAPKRSPDFEGVLLWGCAHAISKATPATACDDHAGVLCALALSRAALIARGHGAGGRRLERVVAKHLHALPRERRGDVAYDLVATDDIRRSPRWDDERRSARAKTVLVAFARSGAGATSATGAARRTASLKTRSSMYCLRRTRRGVVVRGRRLLAL